jgi:bifunctional non-homologous end joining protein LigD
MAESVTIAGVEISRPDKEMFPADGIGKRDLAQYYSDVAATMLPHLAGRPINMQRYPDGIDGQSFFEKKTPTHFPDWIETVEVQTARRKQRQPLVSDEKTLVYLAQQACITPHTWLSVVPGLDSPDLLVFDFDPSGDAGLSEVRRATRVAGELLDDLRLTTFLKTTGSRGFHIYVPLRPTEDFEHVREFARDVASVLVDRDAALFTVEQRKEKRGDRILVDVMRNGYGQTAVPPYAVRARPGAPVSTPIDWAELSRTRPTQHTVKSVRRRLAQRGDPWKGIARRRQSLDRARERLAKLDRR